MFIIKGYVFKWVKLYFFLLFDFLFGNFYLENILNYNELKLII